MGEIFWPMPDYFNYTCTWLGRLGDDVFIQLYGLHWQRASKYHDPPNVTARRDFEFGFRFYLPVTSAFNFGLAGPPMDISNFLSSLPYREVEIGFGILDAAAQTASRFPTIH